MDSKYEQDIMSTARFIRRAVLLRPGTSRITYGEVAERIGWAPNGLGPLLRELVTYYPVTGCAMAASVRRKDGTIGDWRDHRHADGQPCPHKGPNAARRWLRELLIEQESLR